MIYWDTSALIKVYVQEPDSEYFLDLLGAQDSPIVSSSIISQEMICAIYRKEHSGDIKKGTASKIYQRFNKDLTAGLILTISNNTNVVEHSKTLVSKLYNRKNPILIRSLDLIHLSSAISIKAKTMVTKDSRLRDASLVAGIKLLPR